MKKKTLADVVGKPTYDVWIEMLRKLVPGGRTHRLAPIVAGMLHYTLNTVLKSNDHPPKNSIAYSLLKIDEECDDGGVVMKTLLPLVTQLFKDANVKYVRTSSHDKRYSIAETAVHEFINWYNYPWE